MALMQDAFTLLERFKKGIILLVLYVLVVSVIAFPFTGMLIKQVTSDLIPANATYGNVTIVQTEPLELMMLEFKMSLIAGIIAAFPIIFYYAYKLFKARKLGERIPFKLSPWKAVLALLIAAGLFLLGCAYSYVFMLPLLYGYLIESATGAGIASNWKVSEFINFSLLTTIIFGLVFELPLIMTILVRSGIVPLEVFKKYRRHMYIVILIVAAVVTASPDVISQIIIAVPLIIFYEISLLICTITGRVGVSNRQGRTV